MRRIAAPLALTLALVVLASTVFAEAAKAPPAQRSEVGNRISENIPEPPSELLERLNRYQNTRGANFAGWSGNDAILITTRFGETAQVHRVAQPLGMREQITFYREPTVAVQSRPGASGFVFGKDEGGSEFWQLYRYDLERREATRFTDGGRSRNESPLWSHDGRQIAFTSTMSCSERSWTSARSTRLSMAGLL